MARIRTIKPEFWLDEDIAKLSESACLLAIGLLNYADDEGYFNANEKLIMAAVFPIREPSKNILGMIQELSEMGYVQLCQSECGTKTYGCVINFNKHQRVDKPKYSVIKPLCNFQDESKNDPRRIHVGRERKGSGKEGNKRTIPDDFCLTDQMISYASSKGVKNRKVLEDFTEGFILKNKSKNYKYANWYATWQTWFRDALESGKIKPDPKTTKENW